MVLGMHRQSQPIVPVSVIKVEVVDIPFPSSPLHLL